MREIKFRGKRLDDGEWVYGYLCELWTPKGQELRFEIRGCSEYDSLENPIDFFEVDPKTVGQFTGLLDKNGTPIYE